MDTVISTTFDNVALTFNDDGSGARNAKLLGLLAMHRHAMDASNAHWWHVAVVHLLRGRVL